MSRVLNKLGSIANYCCITKSKASELIEKEIIPCVVKNGNVKRYSTYTFLIDFAKEMILNNKNFEFDSSQSKNDLMREIFSKYPLEKNDVWRFGEGDAIVFSNLNLKGGVGKTTTSISIASALSILGARVLLIETDPQSNVSASFGISQDDIGACFSDIVLEHLETNTFKNVEDKIHKFKFTNSKFDALIADDKLLGKMEKLSDNSFLKNVIYRVKNNYDFVVIDTPPSIQAPILQAYAASDFINFVTKLESLSVTGVKNLLNGIGSLNKFNKENGKEEDICMVENVVITDYDGRNLNDQIDSFLKLDDILKDADVGNSSMYRVKKSIVYPESQSEKSYTPIFDYMNRYPQLLEDGEAYFFMALDIVKKYKS